MHDSSECMGLFPLAVVVGEAPSLYSLDHGEDERDEEGELDDGDGTHN